VNICPYCEIELETEEIEWRTWKGKVIDGIRKECPHCGHTIETHGKTNIVTFEMDKELAMAVDKLMEANGYDKICQR
jgi:hypothetical protein